MRVLTVRVDCFKELLELLLGECLQLAVGHRRRDVNTVHLSVVVPAADNHTHSHSSSLLDSRLVCLHSAPRTDRWQKDWQLIRFQGPATQLQLIRPIGAEGLNRRGPAGSCRLFLGPGFRLAARWNRLGETVKMRKTRG